MQREFCFGAALSLAAPKLNRVVSSPSGGSGAGEKLARGHWKQFCHIRALSGSEPPQSSPPHMLLPPRTYALSTAVLILSLVFGSVALATPAKPTLTRVAGTPLQGGA